MNQFWIETYQEFFKDKKIVLGITGSIAAFKAIDLIRLLKKCGAQVKVVCTENALPFVSPLTLQTLSQNPVFTSTNEDGKMAHIELAKWADLILIAPATANTLAKLANGIADDLLSTEVLATKAPVFIAPAMNPTMLLHPASIENLIRLRKWGYTVLDTEFGLHACGDEGYGRMLEPEKIIAEIAAIFCAPSNGKTILINMGPTRSYLDPVRFLSNRSSGKMGTALAFAAMKNGYQVELINGVATENSALPTPAMAQVTKVVTSEEMANAVLKNFQSCDYFFSTAAVLDFEFPKMSSQKVKKDQLKDNFLETLPTLDILKTVGKEKKKNQFILGFAAETENFIPNARKKLKAKNCDAVFVNPISSEINLPQNSTGFESNQNEGTLVFEKKEITFKTQSKTKLAYEILKAIKR